MKNFKEINFDTFLDYFEEAKKKGTRLRMNEDVIEVKIYNEKNNVDQIEVWDAITELGTNYKITIINSGFGKGLYLYFWDTINIHNNRCFKYEKR